MRNALRRLFITLFFFFIAGVLSCGPAHAAPIRYTVNSTDDHDDGACSPGDCTLREAILAANGDGQDSLIHFKIPGPTRG